MLDDDTKSRYRPRSIEDPVVSLINEPVMEEVRLSTRERAERRWFKQSRARHPSEGQADD
jgi:hypothetical protein